MTEKKDKKKTIADLAGSIPNTPDIGEIRENQERDVVKHRYNFEKLEQQLEKLTVGRRKALWEVDKGGPEASNQEKLVLYTGRDEAVS